MFVRLKFLSNIFALLFFISFPLYVFSETKTKFTIVYTANSYSSLYPCGFCPASKGGGIARRATLIEELKKTHKNIVLIEGGNFTAGTELDQANIDFNLDKKRTNFYLTALNKIGYEAVGIADAEFNFGVDFFQEIVKNSNLKFLSSNIGIDGVLPYYIKEFLDPETAKNIKVGFIGLTSKSILKKASIKVEDYEISLAKTISSLKDKVNIFVLVSNLAEDELEDIIKKFPQIKIVLSSLFSPNASYKKIKDTYIIFGGFQAKDVGVAEFEVKNTDIVNFKFETKNLDLSIAEDKEILKIIPTCFKDTDCSPKEGLVEKCNFAGELDAICTYYEANKIDAIAIVDNSCDFCSIEKTVKYLKSLFAGINFNILDYKSEQAQKLIKKYNLQTLPIFIFPQSIKNEKKFNSIEKLIEEKEDVYIAKKSLSGIYLFLNRTEKPNTLDFFIDLYKKNTADILEQLVNFTQDKKIDFNIHFVLPVSEKMNILKDDIKIALAVKQLYPKKFFQYLTLRLKNIESLYWIEILEQLNIDYKKIKSFAKSKTLEDILKKDLEFSKELNINTGNVILVNNRKILQILGVKKEDLEKLF